MEKEIWNKLSKEEKILVCTNAEAHYRFINNSIDYKELNKIQENGKRK